MKKIREWWRKKRFALASRWATAEGLVIVNIQEVAGTAYILCDDGSRMRIGAMSRK
jgi:hypothetical protein